MNDEKQNKNKIDYEICENIAASNISEMTIITSLRGVKLFKTNDKSKCCKEKCYESMVEDLSTVYPKDFTPSDIRCTDVCKENAPCCTCVPITDSELKEIRCLPDNEVISDSNLHNYNEWLKDRIRTSNAIAKKTDRSANRIVMHSNFTTRGDRERRIVIEKATIGKEATLRGFLWEQPYSLPRCCDCKPVYDAVRPCPDRGVSHVEYIDVPRDIREEQGVSGEPFQHPKSLTCSKYKMFREQELAPDIEVIEPHRPDLKHLYIQGGKPKPRVEPLLLPSIVISKHYSKRCFNDKANVTSLRVNDSLFFKTLNLQCLYHLKQLKKTKFNQNKRIWNYYFHFEANQKITKTIYLENYGTVSIRYCWHQIEQYLQFLPNETRAPVFFFNKNADVLNPGQKRTIEIDSFSTDPGIYKEIWQLQTDATFFKGDNNNSFLFIFDADITENDIDYFNIEKMKLFNYIYNEACYLMINEFLNTAIDKVFVKAPEFYPYKKLFDESDMFVLRNPLCYYHQTEVELLKQLYDSLRKEEWDLRINASLRDAIMEQPFEMRTHSYSRLRKSYKTLLRPWHEGDTLILRKYTAVKRVLQKFATKFEVFESWYGTLVTFPFMEYTNTSMMQMHIAECFGEAIDEISAVLASLDVYKQTFFDFPPTDQSQVESESGEYIQRSKHIYLA